MEHTKTASEVQAERERAKIKIEVIENGILVGAGADGWFTFPTWEGKGGAAEHIGLRIERLKAKRLAGAPRGGC